MTIPHSLGETPKIAILIADNNEVGYYTSTNGRTSYVWFACMSYYKQKDDNSYPVGYFEGLSKKSTAVYSMHGAISSGSGTDYSKLDETKAVFTFSYTINSYYYSGYYKPGVEYTLITIA